MDLWNAKSPTKPAATAKARKPRKAKKRTRRSRSAKPSHGGEPKPDRIYTTKAGKRYVLRQLAD
jgi:ribosomal protein L44E